VIGVIAVVGACFGLELLFSHPAFREVAVGFLPHAGLWRDPQQLYLAIGILGATVMPHNLYLHSSIVQTRSYVRDAGGKREAIKYATLDSTVALFFALFINAAILITAAAAFHTRGRNEVAELGDAYNLLSPLLGVGAASAVFAIGLLASGQNSTLTGTLAGQIAMEGFLKLRIRPWLRRLVTRGLAIIPAAIVTALYGEEATGKLLIFSQVILSLQLSFAVIPLVLFTGDRKKMGEFVSPLWLRIAAWTTAAVIVVLNAKYLLDFFGVTGHP
jgi:manganese transport protein